MQIKPKKRLGQNFLIDKNIRQKIITACNFSADDIILEIGSGRGELTREIAAEEKVKKIYALEIDNALVKILKDNLEDFSNIEVIHQDILKFNFDGFFAKEKNRIKVFGNIPYYITTPIIEYLFRWRVKISTVYLTVQKEFAERLAAPPGSKKYGSLSCFIQYYAQPKVIFTIKKNCFFPVPKVDSVFLRLRMLPQPVVEVEDEKRFFKIIRSSFGKRRKTLRNSLKNIIPEGKLEIFFNKYKITHNIRPEQLSLQDFAHLANI